MAVYMSRVGRSALNYFNIPTVLSNVIVGGSEVRPQE